MGSGQGGEKKTKTKGRKGEERFAKKALRRGRLPEGEGYAEVKKAARDRGEGTFQRGRIGLEKPQKRANVRQKEALKKRRVVRPRAHTPNQGATGWEKAGEKSGKKKKPSLPLGYPKALKGEGASEEVETKGDALCLAERFAPEERAAKGGGNREDMLQRGTPSVPGWKTP